MKNIVDQDLLRVIIVGVFDTFLGMVTMFGFYHLGMGYWGASGLSYFLCSIVSFFLNKHFTFKNEDSLAQTGLRFAVNIAVCYFAAYLVAKPAVRWLVSASGLQLTVQIVDQVAMLAGMCFFTAFNYLGQKFIVFGRHKERTS